MNIIKGKVPAPVKALLYGPEGIGKTTFASKWANPLFIDIEGGSSTYDVARTEKPSSWNMLMATIGDLEKDSMGFKTLVIDTADWAQSLCSRHVCDKAGKAGIEDFGYGKGWIALAEEFGRLLDKLAVLQKSTGMHVLFLAHAWTRKFDAPEQTDSYDRWELKMEKKTASLIKEWADLMLFANYEIIVEETESKRMKARGGKRVMYSSHHACWDAKNRYGLPDKMAMDFAAIAGVFSDTPPAPPAPQQSAKPATSLAPIVPAKPAAAASSPDRPPASPPAPPAAPSITTKPTQSANIPEPLWNLMTMSGVSEEEIRKAVALRGYYPEDTPIAKYKPEFINGVLVAAWEKVKHIIETQVRKV